MFHRLSCVDMAYAFASSETASHPISSTHFQPAAASKQRSRNAAVMDATAFSAASSARPSELISRPLRTDYFPLVPKLLPTPVTKSYPDLQLKLPAVPETMSRKSLVPIFE